MSNDAQPQWHSGIDRWVLIIGGVLAVVAVLWTVSLWRKAPAAPTPAPSVLAEASPAATPAASPAAEITPAATSAESAATPAGESTPAPPAQPQNAEVASPSSGASLSAEAPGAISGVAPPGSAITVSENGAILAQTSAGEDGAWQIDLPTLPPGQHELTVTATDAEGQPLGEPQTLVVVAVPAASVTAPVINAPAAASEAETTTLSGLAPPGSTVTVYEGDNILGETTADENGNWSLTLPTLAAGEHTLEATATDASGQPHGQPDSIALVVETASPAAQSTPTTGETPAVAAEITPGAGATAPGPGIAAAALLSNLAAPLNNSRPTFRGTAAPASQIVLFEGKKRLGEAEAGERGNWLLTPGRLLAPGEHQLRIEITAPGAQAPEIIETNIIVSEDARPLTPPRIEKPRRNRLGVGNQLSGRAPAGTTVEILDGDEVIGVVSAGSGGRWAFRLPATTAAGEHSFRLVVRGAEGEVLAESAPLTLHVLNGGPPRLLPPTGGGG